MDLEEDTQKVNVVFVAYMFPFVLLYIYIHVRFIFSRLLHLILPSLPNN